MRYGMPSTRIILVGILPRAGWTLPNETGYPNRFTTPTSQANTHIQVGNTDCSLIPDEGGAEEQSESCSSQVVCLTLPLAGTQLRLWLC